MRTKLNEQMKLLNRELLEMGNTVENSIQRAVDAFMTLDVKTAREIMQSDVVVDSQEREIQSLCFDLVMQQQPVAGDLRFISAAMNMVTDMERIGDHAADISELTILLAKDPWKYDIDTLKQMASETIPMLIRSIQAFVEKDAEMARQVIAHDDVVDGLFLKVKDQLVRKIHDDVNCGEQAADLLMTAKYFERIGDHATNLAEWAIFGITGEFPR